MYKFEMDDVLDIIRLSHKYYKGDKDALDTIYEMLNKRCLANFNQGWHIAYHKGYNDGMGRGGYNPYCELLEEFINEI